MIVGASFSGVDSASAQILSLYQSSAPVNVVGIANSLGVEVWEDDLPPGISGKIFRDNVNGGKSGFSIVVNHPEPLVRKRFTLAHEIAHFLLHRDHIGSGLDDDALYRSKLSSGMETQANRLAAEILMPMALIGNLIDSGMGDVGALARKLVVSEAALKIRLGLPVT